MTTWIFENAGKHEKQIEERLTEAGGEIREKRKLDKGGIVFRLVEEKAVLAISKIRDWCSREKIRCHKPKSMLHGTLPLFIRHFEQEYDEEQVIDALKEHGVEPVDLYMIKSSNGQYTGMVKVTVKNNKKAQDWVNEGRTEIYRMHLQVERERRAKVCYNCYKYGHKIAECTNEKLCKRCGKTGHLHAKCEEKKEELEKKCGYCREEGHKKQECLIKKKDERKEREDYKQDRELRLKKNVWEQRLKEKAAREESQKHKQEEQRKQKEKEEGEEWKRGTKEMVEGLIEGAMKTAMNEMKEMVSIMMENTRKELELRQEKAKEERKAMNEMMKMMKDMMENTMKEVRDMRKEVARENRKPPPPPPTQETTPKKTQKTSEKRRLCTPEQKRDEQRPTKTNIRLGAVMEEAQETPTPNAAEQARTTTKET